MKSLLPFIALSVAWCAPAPGQMKPLLQKGRITTTLTFDGPRTFALPTACDDKGRSYVKVWKPDGKMTEKPPAGPVFRVSDKGVIEAQFNSNEMLGNIFAVRPDGGIAALVVSIGKGGMQFLGKTKVIDNFGPDGARESQVRLETPPIPIEPMQIAVFPSGGFFLAGQEYRDEKKISAAVYDAEGHLLKQVDWEETDEEPHAVSGSSDKAAAASESPSRSIAITGDDGYVYFMRAMFPPSIYVISSAGEIVRKLVVKGSAGTNSPYFGLRMVENRLLVEFYRDCQTPYDEILARAKVEIDPSCGRKVYTIVDATTGERIADFEPDPRASGPMACYVPDLDHFYTFSFDFQAEGHPLEMIETAPK